MSGYKTKEELERLASDEVNELCKNHILKQDEKYYARLGFIRGYQQKERANEASTSENKVLDIDFVIETLKTKLEINAGRLAEPLLKQGKQPKEDKDCHEAFIMCAHLAEIEKYLSSR